MSLDLFVVKVKGSHVMYIMSDVVIILSTTVSIHIYRASEIVCAIIYKIIIVYFTKRLPSIRSRRVDFRLSFSQLKYVHAYRQTVTSFDKNCQDRLTDASTGNG